jgi:hypothetical protein
MVLRLIEENKPLDEVRFCDTGMEFKAIYNVRDKLLPILKENNIKYTELKPEKPFEYYMLEIPLKKKHNIGKKGYSWCGGCCRWGTTFKTNEINKHTANLRKKYDVVEYVGIAYDELRRVKDKTYPLVEWKMTEADCLQYCYDKGFNWDENGIDLYTMLDRVSCWCCANKNKKELYNIYKYLPEYWSKLKDLQSKTDRPMKKFCNKKYGNYGNVFDMENAFKDMEANQK